MYNVVLRNKHLSLQPKTIGELNKRHDIEQKESSPKNFADHLKEEFQSVNQAQKISDRMASNLAIGKTENIHETMLALSQAEIGLKLMVQVRNKAIEAYHEIMRMQV